jgi:hypothetical protein
MQTAVVGLSRNRTVARALLPGGLPGGLPVGLSVALLVALLAGCGSDPTSPPAPTGTAVSTTAPVTPSAGAPTTTPFANTPPATGTAGTTPGAVSTTPDLGTNGATPAPSWLGTRVLAIGPDGFGVVQPTPPELRDRRIITTDLLPPPVDGRFRSRITAVPADVARRSTWSAECPVKLSDLRYVTVSFLGFDGRGHTGELLLHQTVAADVVTVFQQLYTVGWPIEQMRITSPADLNAKPTGDGNDTSAFACRPVRGSKSWSQHAYGLAIDLNPFHNPYVDGSTVLPELSTSYADRSRRLAGMNLPGSPPVNAFKAIGWGWGGDYSSKKDWMHFSSNGK